MFERSSRSRSSFALALGMGTIAMLASCKDLKGGAHCGTFEGDAMSARWSACSDKVKRQIQCKALPSLGMQMIGIPKQTRDITLDCDCLEDGAIRFSFRAKEPPLASREDATRL